MFFSPTVNVERLNLRLEGYHWSALSQTVATTDQLFSALLDDWMIHIAVIERVISFSGGRFTHIYYFRLRRDGEYMTMPVGQTPTLLQFMADNPVDLIDYEKAKQVSVAKRQAKQEQVVHEPVYAYA